MINLRYSRNRLQKQSLLLESYLEKNFNNLILKNNYNITIKIDSKNTK